MLRMCNVSGGILVFLAENVLFEHLHKVYILKKSLKL